MKKINTTWIIDDDPIQVFVAKRNLQIIDFSQNILAFENGKNALEELQKIPTSKDSNFPDVIFLDINMPEMDGWQFLEEFEVISLDKQVAIYLLTSSMDPLDSKRAEAYKSLTGFLLKPVKKEDLQEIRKNYEEQ